MFSPVLGVVMKCRGYSSKIQNAIFQIEWDSWLELNGVHQIFATTGTGSAGNSEHSRFSARTDGSSGLDLQSDMIINILLPISYQVITCFYLEPVPPGVVWTNCGELHEIAWSRRGASSIGVPQSKNDFTSFQIHRHVSWLRQKRILLLSLGLEV